MSLTSVRAYFRSRMNSLSDYREHTDGFNFENIPQSLFNKSYHIESGIITGVPANQTVHVFEYPVTLRVFFRGFRDPAAGIDEAITQSESILAEVLDPDNRLGTAIKDVTPLSIEVQPYEASNDNDIILVMDFNAIINCAFS